MTIYTRGNFSTVSTDLDLLLRCTSAYESDGFERHPPWKHKERQIFASSVRINVILAEARAF